MSTKIIDLPNGESLLLSEITAIRKGDYEFLEEDQIKLLPRVIIDFGKRHGNCTVVEFQTDIQRDEFAKKVREMWEKAIED